MTTAGPRDRDIPHATGRAPRHDLSRRAVLRGTTAAAALAAATAATGLPAAAVPRRPAADRPAAAEAPGGAPTLHFADAGRQADLGVPYEAAVRNLLETNTVGYDPAVYDRTGLMTDPPGTFFRAGGGYEQPWTRDASINTWNAGNLLAPDVARNTLWAVVERGADGRLIVQQDDQWWDQVIWTLGAESQYAVTGDRAFLADAYATVRTTMAHLRATRFDERYGLYRGPAVMQDGIAGYPSPPYEEGNTSSFVLDHPGTDRMMCLSTNCLYVGAFAAAARMAERLGRPHAERRAHLAAARELTRAINAGLWSGELGRYGYFRHGAGPLAGKLDTHEESCGVAFAVLFGVAGRARAGRLLARHHQQPHGVVNVWPHFDRFSDERPGRHEVIVWPMVQAMWAHAAAAAGRTDLFARQLEELAGLVRGSGGNFYELYDSISGEQDGGWQVGTHWGSEPDQTWSATGYLRMVHAGLFGLEPTPDGLRLAPRLPHGWGPVRLAGVRYRGATVSVTLSGHGSRVRRATLDGRRLARPYLPAHLTGRHEVAFELA